MAEAIGCARPTGAVHYQLVRSSKGAEATPAGWQPGQPTLEPGPDLVGNVWKVWKPSMER
jgi:peroxiredoxin (alkyl hydroperoxide reductase subunit C)